MGKTTKVKRIYILLNKLIDANSFYFFYGILIFIYLFFPKIGAIFILVFSIIILILKAKSTTKMFSDSIDEYYKIKNLDYFEILDGDHKKDFSARLNFSDHLNRILKTIFWFAMFVIAAIVTLIGERSPVSFFAIMISLIIIALGLVYLYRKIMEYPKGTIITILLINYFFIFVALFITDSILLQIIISICGTLLILFMIKILIPIYSLHKVASRLFWAGSLIPIVCTVINHILKSKAENYFTNIFIKISESPFIQENLTTEELQVFKTEFNEKYFSVVDELALNADISAGVFCAAIIVIAISILVKIEKSTKKANNTFNQMVLDDKIDYHSLKECVYNDEEKYHNSIILKEAMVHVIKENENSKINNIDNI